MVHLKVNLFHPSNFRRTGRRKFPVERMGLSPKDDSRNEENGWYPM